LLVCGQNGEHQFDAPNIAEQGTTHEHATQQPTARVLSKTEMSNLIQSIRTTGFEQLDPEYFELPIAQNQHTVRLTLKGTEKAVLYFNDVAPPAAYTQTLSIMKDACAKTTTPYISTEATVRARVDVNVAGKEVETIDVYDQETATSLKDTLNKAKAVKRGNDAKKAANQQVEEEDEFVQSVKGTAAQSLQKSANSKATKFISYEGANYEVAVNPDMPRVNNPMDIDYNKLRAETNKIKENKGKSTASRVFEALDPSQTASAQTVGGYRVVLLLASNAGSTGKSDEAQSFASRMKTWSCNEVGKCPNYKGFSVIRGSQTQAYYNACHRTTCNGNQLLNILYNVATKDPNTIYRSDVSTIVIPGWKTNTLSTSGAKACGWGSQPGTIATIDLYQTETVNGLNCTPLGPTFPHEYFHNKGLGHFSECSNRNLMVGPPGCRYGNSCGLVGTAHPICLLNSTQASKLRSLSHY
jgi:hypothetical protein